MSGGLLVVIILSFLVLLVIAKTARIVPQQSAYVVERLGRYSRTLGAGFHILVPFIDSVQYKHSLKETAIDIPEQICITRDNVQVSIDGIIYLKILDPQFLRRPSTSVRRDVGPCRQSPLATTQRYVHPDHTRSCHPPLPCQTRFRE